MKKISPVIVVVLWLSATGIAAAQTGTVGDTDIEVFNISGNISTEAHGYATTRGVNRRAPLGNVTTLSSSFNVLGFSSGINLRYNTDDSRLRQSMNEIGFSGSWRWLSMSAGDVSPSWSRYSLSGTRIRGGQLELTPGNFLLEVTGGRANRAIGPSGNGEEHIRRLSFQRMLYGGRIGFGDQSRSYFILSGFYAKDDPESIELPESDEELFSRRNFSPPAENLLVSPEFQLSLFNQAFQIGAQASASAFTRDLRSQKINVEDAGLPSFITDIMEVHTSTRLGFAGTAYSTFNIRPFDIHLEYERIQPGFETLGIRSTRDDQQRYSADVGLSLFNQRLQLDNSLGFDEDNLLGDRMQTQKGMDYSLNTSARLTDAFNLSAGYSIYQNTTEAADPDVATRHGSHTTQSVNLSPMYNFMRNDNSHNITVSTFYQSFESRTETDDGEHVTEGYTLNSAFNYSLSFFGGFRINTGINGLLGDTAGSEMRNFGFNAGTGYSFFDGDLNTNLNLSASRNSVSRSDQNMGEIENISWQFNGNGTLSYQIAGSASMQFSVRTNNNTISSGAGAGFSEFESRLSFNYRF